MGQIRKKSLVSLSVCQCVSQCVGRRSDGRNFYSIFMKPCTVIRDLKSKIEFALGENPMTPFPILPQFFLPL